jgi:hypothetical protein
MNTIVIVYYDVQWEHNLFVNNFVSGISSMLFNSKHQHILFSGVGVGFDDVEQRKLRLKKLLSILFLFCTYGNITGSSILCCLFCTGSSKRTRYNYGQCSLFKLVWNVYYLCNLYSHSIVIDQCVFILSRFKFVKDGKYKARITFYNLTTRKYWNIETSL